jgi:hypothetical protein
MAKKQNQNANGDQTRSPTIDVCHEDNAVVVRIPVKFYRRNGRQMVLAHDDASGRNHQAAPAPNSALAANLAKAWMWQEQLESSEYGTLEELANANKVDRTYVGRILQLTSLSPKVVEKILDGNEPAGVSLRQLRKGVPVVWSEQF